MESHSKGRLYLVIALLCVSVSATAGLVTDFDPAQGDVSNLSISLVNEPDVVSLSVTEQFIKNATSGFSADRTQVSFVDIETDDVIEAPSDLVDALHTLNDSKGQTGIQYLSDIVSNLLISTGQ